MFNLETKKIYSGVVYDVHDKAPKVSSVKYILSILDEEPIISELSFNLWQWIASYYMCYLGDVMSAALPSALRLKSETKIIIHPDFDGDITSLSQDESKVFEVVSRKESIEIKDAIQTTGNDNILPLLNAMIRKNLIITEEELSSKYRPKVEEYISMSKEYRDEEKLKELFTRLESKKTLQKQYETILIFLSIAKNKDNEIKKSDLTKQPNISLSAIKNSSKR